MYKDMEVKEEILCLTYNQRKEAIRNGAIFTRGNFFSNTKSIWKMDKEKSSDSLLAYSKTIIEEQKEEETIFYQKWEEILEEGCTLLITKALKDIGVPKDLAQRIQMLQILNTISKDQYRISWEALIDYSDSFNEIYGWNRYMKIAEEKNLGKKDYRIEIETNGLTAEEKAFVKFIFPIGDR